MKGATKDSLPLHVTAASSDEFRRMFLRNPYPLRIADLKSAALTDLRQKFKAYLQAPHLQSLRSLDACIGGLFGCDGATVATPLCPLLRSGPRCFEFWIPDSFNYVILF